MTPSAGGNRFDLDAARAARAAERASSGKGPGAVVIAGEEFELPPELSLDVLNCFGALSAGDPGALSLALRALLNGGLDVKGAPIIAGEDDDEPEGEVIGYDPTPYDRALELAGGFTIEDAEWLVDEVTACYGVEAPKSHGSAASSPGDGAPSSPTSDGSTG